MRPFLPVLLIWAAVLASPLEAGSVIAGIDHIPVAVRDLEAAKADYKALGFTFKQGRPHKNGLRNVHMKFPDGTSLELITAPRAVDALSSNYHAWLKKGDGPAFLGIYAPDIDMLMQRLTGFGHEIARTGNLVTFRKPKALQRLFFARRQHSPTDRPEHFSHPNTAFSLAGVWLAGGRAELALLQKLEGASRSSGQKRCGPSGAAMHHIKMAEGEVLFLPEAAQLYPGRSIIGVTVRVKSLDTVQKLLAKNRIPAIRPEKCHDDSSLWVVPEAAHGMWIEFRQTLN